LHLAKAVNAGDFGQEASALKLLKLQTPLACALAPSLIRKRKGLDQWKVGGLAFRRLPVPAMAHSLFAQDKSVLILGRSEPTRLNTEFKKVLGSQILPPTSTPTLQNFPVSVVS
jgi:hypothetical protein